MNDQLKNDKERKDNINKVFTESLGNLKSMFSVVETQIKKSINDDSKIQSLKKAEDIKASLLSKFNLN